MALEMDSMRLRHGVLHPRSHLQYGSDDPPAYWISKSPDPLFTDPRLSYIRVLHLATALRNEAEASEWDILRTRAALCQKTLTIGGEAAIETVQPVWIAQDQGRLRGIILIPRHPMQRARARLVVLQPREPNITRRLEELPQVLAAFGIGNAVPKAKELSELLP
jgi:hypothetical protein